MKGIYLTQLCLKGTNVPDASITFDKGVNLITGPSNTGKTFIFECIDYMLGQKSLERRIKESRKYHTAFLELKGFDNSLITLKSDLEGGDFQKFEIPFHEITDSSEYKTIKREHEPGREDTLSYQILNKCGLSGAKVRINAKGKTRELSLRDLRILHLISELKILTDKSPYLTGQYIHDTVEKSVIKLLISGEDDSNIIETMSDKKVANKKGRLELLSELIGQNESRLDKDFSYETASKRKKTLESESSELKNERDRLFAITSEIEAQRRAKSEELVGTQNRIRELKRLLENSNVLKQQYYSDIKRLNSTIEASLSLEDIGESNCPVCESVVSTAQIPDIKTISQCATAELGKIENLIFELEKAQKQFSDELAEVFEQEQELSQVIPELELKSKKLFKDEIEGISNITEHRLNEIKELSKQMYEYDRIKDLKDKRESLNKLIESQPPKKRQFNELNTDLMESITSLMTSFLVDWGYPNASTIKFDKDASDFIIGSEARNLAGKGYRAITFAAYLMSLVKYEESLENRFGFCLMDSPLVTYKKPDVPKGEQISTDMAHNFYQSLSSLDKNSQIIVIENEEIPEQLKNKFTNHIHFTKNVDFGRYGFFPD